MLSVVRLSFGVSALAFSNANAVLISDVYAVLFGYRLKLAH